MQIYYINLAQRTDRRDFMEAQFARLGLAATRIDALTPAALTPAEIDRWCNPARGRWLTPTELSCSRSHIAAMQALLVSGNTHALILEDDSLLSPRLPRFLTAFERSPPNVGLVRIETTNHSLRLRPADRTLEGVGLNRLYSWTAGAGGYIVGRDAAEILAASRELWLKPTDQVMFNPYEPLPRRLGLLQTDLGLTIQTENIKGEDRPHFASSMEDRKRRGHDEAPHFWRRLPHNVWVAFERDIIVGLQKAWHEHVRGAKKRRVPFAAD